MLQRVFYWSKKIHTLMMWLMIVLGVPVAITGVLLEGERGEGLLSASQMYDVRRIHNEWSGKFSLVLAIMMITGFMMWLLPKILSQNVKGK